MAGGVGELIKFWIAISPPNVVTVSAHEASKISALGAAALAHSVSRIASASFGGTTPGALQLLPPFAGDGWTVVKEEVYPDSPNVERKVFQSEVLKTSVFSISAIV
jgi:hypothetical protein